MWVGAYMDFLELNELTKNYGSFVAVNKFSLKVKKGEFISLLGPSGCGKTTTLQMMTGLVEATHGSLILDGRDITRLSPAMRGLGVVFQSYALFPHMTVRENVAFGLEMRRVPKAERQERVKKVLDMVQLSNLSDRYPRQMSGGQRQRVAIARALVITPPVLLLDEPLSNLDAKLREEMQFELRRIQNKVGITTIMVTHDQSEALSISDRVVVMEKGSITQVGSPYELYENPQNDFISSFVGKSNILSGEFANNIENGKALTIRPEKIKIVSLENARLKGKVVNRFFLGASWLITIEGPAGYLTISIPNVGDLPPLEGEVVGVSWNETDCRVITIKNAGDAS